MQARRMGEWVWALRLIGGHACHRAGIYAARLALPLLPGALQLRAAERLFAGLAPMLQSRRSRRLADALQHSGHALADTKQLVARSLARTWLRQVRRAHLRSLPFDQLQRHLRRMAWHDPLALWPAAAGRRRVICLLPTGDTELAVAALLDRPGAPAHYFIQCPYAEGSVERSTLLALKRQGHRLDISPLGRIAGAWRHLRRGASVVTVLHVPGDERLNPGAGPLRLARLANVPVLLMGHRHDGAEAGALHVLGEFGNGDLSIGSPALLASARRFLAEVPEDWH